MGKEKLESPSAVEQRRHRLTSLQKNELLQNRPARLDQRFLSWFPRSRWNKLRQSPVSRRRKEGSNQLSRSKKPASRKKSPKWKPNLLKSRLKRRPPKRHPKKQLRMPKKNQNPPAGAVRKLLLRKRRQLKRARLHQHEAHGVLVLENKIK